MKRYIPVILILLALVSLAPHMPNPCSGEVYDAREYGSPGFRVRTEVRSSGCSLDWHPLVVFMAAPAGSGEWREAMTGWTDEASAGPGERRVHFIDARAGYVFFNDRYAATTDGGRTWSVWRAGQYFARDEEDVFIEEVEVRSGGQGAMSVKVPGSVPTNRWLHTSDYGRSWRSD